jgi:hypothetical protein
MSKLAKDARDTAAKSAGLRPDQVEAAVAEYRKALLALHDEPEWKAIMHVSYRDGGGIGQYRDLSGQTEILMQIETGKGGKDGVRVYVLDGKPFETYGEARSVELLASAHPKPRLVQPQGDSQ